MKLFLEKPIAEDYWFKEHYFELNYWSFVKCYVLAYLGLVGIIFVVVFFAGLIVALFGGA